MSADEQQYVEAARIEWHEAEAETGTVNRGIARANWAMKYAGWLLAHIDALRAQVAALERELAIVGLREKSEQIEQARLSQQLDALTARLAEAHAALGNMIGLAAYLDECDYWFGEQIEPTAKERIAKARALLTPPPTPGEEERE